MKTRPREEAERERIVESYIAIAGDRGFPATSLEDVLALAEVDEDTFHHYFEDEGACFRAAWDSISEPYMVKALAAYQSQEEWREQIRAVALAVFEYVTEHPRRGRILFVDGPTPGEVARAPVDDPNIDAFVELIDQGRWQMADPEALTRATAEGLFGSVKECIAQYLERGRADELETIFPQLMALVVRPYLGNEAASEELSRGLD